MNLRALGSASFRLYLAANFLSICGIWINRVILGWLGWHITQSAWWVGVIAFLLFAPTLLAGPFFGVIADRIDVRRGSFVTQAALSILMAILWGAFAAGVLDRWLLVILAFLFGLTASANHPIRLTLVPRLVPRDAIPSAVNLISINFNAGRLVGPAIGGLMIQHLDVGVTMLTSLAATLPMFAAILRLEPRSEARTAGHGTHMLSDLVEGARYTLGSQCIVQTIVIVTVTALIPRGALEVLPVVSDVMFGRGADGLGQLLSAAGAGALISGLLIALMGGQHDEARQLRGSYAWMIVGVLAVCLLPFAATWWLALLLVAAMGASGTFTAIYTQSIIQLRTADGLRGRVISLWLFTGMGGNALGALGFGALADLFTMPVSLMALGGTGLVISGLCLIWARTLRGQF